MEELVKGGWFFIIEDRLENKKIGFIVYYLVRSDYLHLFEIGYRIKPSERRKGLHDRSRTTPCRSPLYNEEGNRKNRVSNRRRKCALPEVLEKNGFKREEELRKRYFNKGQYRNEYMYNLLREEWKEPKILTRVVQHQ